MSQQAHKIAITSANSRLGQDLMARLTATGTPDGTWQITALVRTPTELFGRLAGTEIVTDWMTSPKAATALASADTVIHLSGVFAAPTWDAYEDGIIATTRRVVDTAGDAARIVYVSYVGADATAANWYVRAKGQAEELLTERAGGDVVVFRVHPIVRGNPEPSPLERMLTQVAPDQPVRVLGDGRQRFSPLYAGDLVDAITAAATGTGRAGTYDLVGPDDLAMTEMVALINGHQPPLDFVPVPPGPTVEDVFARPTTPAGATAAAQTFGLALTSMREIWPLGATA